jgi:hypothetical protein
MEEHHVHPPLPYLFLFPPFGNGHEHEKIASACLANHLEGGSGKPITSDSEVKSA